MVATRLAPGTPVKNPDSIRVADMLHVAWETAHGFMTSRFIVSQIVHHGMTKFYYAQSKLSPVGINGRIMLNYTAKGFHVDGSPAVVTSHGSTLLVSPTLPGMETL